MPRWTTARAVSRGADLMLRVVEPTFSPSKESTGTVASSAWIVAAARRRRRGKLRVLGEGFGVDRNIEEEKKEIEEGAAVAIVVQGDRERGVRRCYPIFPD